MIYRHKESNKFAITIAGIGNAGMDAASGVSKKLEEIMASHTELACKHINNFNEVSFICNIEAESVGESRDDLILWDDIEIDAENKTKRILILLGDPAEPVFNMFHSTAISILSDPSYMRVAFLICDKKHRSVNNPMFSQQMDHVVLCDGVADAAETAKEMLYCTYFPAHDIETFGDRNFRTLIGSTREKIYATHERWALFKDKFVTAAIQQASARLLKEVNKEKEYVVFAYLEGDISLGELNQCIDKMRETLGNHVMLKDEIIALTVKESHDVNCFLSFIEA